MKTSWVKVVFDPTINLLVVKCKVCTKIKRKKKLLVPKWDSLEKHVGKRKNEERVKVVDVKCAHAKNETKFVSINHPSIF
jgi:hypothetical protein